MSEDPAQSMDVALFLDRLSMVEWPGYRIATDFQEWLPEVTPILFLEAEQEGSRQPQNRLLTATGQGAGLQSIALSCEHSKPRTSKSSRIAVKLKRVRDHHHNACGRGR